MKHEKLLYKGFWIITGISLLVACGSRKKESRTNIGMEAEVMHVTTTETDSLIDSLPRPSCFPVINSINLPYKGGIDIHNVRYEISSCSASDIKGLLCDMTDSVRYIPLFRKGDISVVLYPVDCGDFPYNFHLLTTKDNQIIADLYVEGEWYEELSNREHTSFEIDDDYHITVTKTWDQEDLLGSSGRKTYRILEGGLIEEI